MSIVDKVIAAVTPPESDKARVEARAKARAAAESGSWLEMALDHHLGIEDAFAQVKAATTSAERLSAQKALALLLTGHSNAEETTIYPALANNGEKAHAEMAYVEQSAAKVQMAALEMLDPMSQDYLAKLEHIRGAVAHHVYEEEGSRFLELLEKATPDINAHITMRYAEEYQRYSGKRSEQYQPGQVGELGQATQTGRAGASTPAYSGGLGGNP